MGVKADFVLRVPAIPDGELTRYRLLGVDSNQISATFGQAISKYQENGKQYYKVHTTTEYIQGDVAEDISTLEVAEFLKPISSRRLVKKCDGTILTKLFMRFPDSSPKDPLNPILPGVQGVCFCLRGCTFTQNKFTINSMAMEGYPFRQRVTISKEKVTVPAGEFNCYKVDVFADNMDVMGIKPPPGMGGMIERLIPSNRYWYSVESPHHMVKFQGFAMSAAATIRTQAIVGEEAVGELLSIETP